MPQVDLGQSFRSCFNKISNSQDVALSEPGGATENVPLGCQICIISSSSVANAVSFFANCVEFRTGKVW